MKYKYIKDQLREGMTIKRTKGSCCQHEVGLITKITYQNDSLFPWKTTERHSLDDNDEIEILSNPDGSPWRGVGTSSSPTQCAYGHAYLGASSYCMNCGEKTRTEPVSERSESSGRQFQVGDRVLKSGKPGTIVAIDEVGDIAIQMDRKEDSDRHDCGIPSKCKPGYGTWSFKSHAYRQLQLIEPAPVTEINYIPKWYEWDSGELIYWDEVNKYFKPLTASGSAKGTTQGQSLIKKKSMLDTAIQSLKAKLSKTDRSLVRAGYLNSDGSRTSAYEEQLKQLVLEELINEKDSAEFRKELAAELKNCDE